MKSAAAPEVDWEAELRLLEESRKPQPTDFSSVHLDAGSFPEQMAFVHDDSPFQAVLCTRRAAKSYSGGLKGYQEGMRFEGCNVLIAGLSQEEIYGIWWKDILLDIAERHAIPIVERKSELSITLPNRSTILLLGMDANEKQKRNALGRKYRLVIADEAQDWSTDLNTVVFHTLKAAVADWNGIIALMGTPGLVARGLFFDVTTGKEPGWKVHSWDTYANTTRRAPGEPTMAQRWDSEVQQLRSMKPGVEETAWFKRNYRKLWVIEESALVYRYQSGRNGWGGVLPTFLRGEWRYVLGCDLGYEDKTAFVVCAYHDHDRRLFVLEVIAKSGLDVTGAAILAKSLDAKYHFDAWVVDGANKQAVEEMRKRHEIPWKAADKRGKSDFIEMMNAEFLTGGILVHEKECALLVEEYQKLVWDEKKLKATGKHEEDARCDNHCTDAGLYAWRFCYPYLAEPAPKEKERPGTPAFLASFAKQAADDVDSLLEGELEQATRTERQRVEAEWEDITRPWD